MKKQVFNPYLPLNTYIPDGEPHVFGDRVYIYGSHDSKEATAYCPGHYEVWSAPVDDLTEWRCDGTSYLRFQDPSNKEDKMQLWAPDVTQGPDGKYYLFYCFSFYPEIGVAVSDKPEGPFEFHGHVHYPDSINDGAVLREFMPFDPAVLTDDDGRVYLYFSFCPAEEKEMLLPDLSEEELAKMPPDKREMMEHIKTIKFGEYAKVVELESDMLTMKYTPKDLIPGGHHTAGTGFEGHGFFEAASIRKIRGKYYFVYSSHKSHELCYATSERPDEGFTYGGIIVSNGDIGLDGRDEPVYTLGNNHGGIAQIGDDFYIFYHRQTAGTEFSRQGCAEKIEIAEDGSIMQVPITSCGLNRGALVSSGSYSAAIACHITCPTTMKNIDYNNPVMREQTRIVECQYEQFITDIQGGTVVGYKYFDFENVNDVLVEVRGKFTGNMIISTTPDSKGAVGTAEIDVDSENFENYCILVDVQNGTAPLYFLFEGEGRMDMKRFGFISD